MNGLKREVGMVTMYLGLFLMILGVLLLLKNLGIIAADFWSILCPLIIVFFGILMLFVRKGRRGD